MSEMHLFLFFLKLQNRPYNKIKTNVTSEKHFQKYMSWKEETELGRNSPLLCDDNGERKKKRLSPRVKKENERMITNDDNHN